jgi:hypothetical protein
MEDQMVDQTKFKVGDRVTYDYPGSPDHGSKGTVTWIGYNGFEVEWSDGEKIDYRFSVASSIHKA